MNGLPCWPARRIKAADVELASLPVAPAGQCTVEG
jgi:hypothetical protein